MYERIMQSLNALHFKVDKVMEGLNFAIDEETGELIDLEAENDSDDKGIEKPKMTPKEVQ